MKSSASESKPFQSRSKGETPGLTKRKERPSRFKLKQTFLIDSDAEVFIYFLQWNWFGSWKVRRLNRTWELFSGWLLPGQCVYTYLYNCAFRLHKKLYTLKHLKQRGLIWKKKEILITCIIWPQIWCLKDQKQHKRLKTLFGLHSIWLFGRKRGSSPVAVSRAKNGDRATCSEIVSCWSFQRLSS